MRGVNMSLMSVVVLAMIGEALWETLKMLWQHGKLNIDRIGALTLGIALALGTGLNLMDLVGIPFKIKIIGVILTGILISRGANFMHDLLAAVGNLPAASGKASSPDNSK